MTYEEAFTRAAEANCNLGRTTYVVKYRDYDDYIPSWFPVLPDTILIGEVRRMTPR